MRASTVGSRFLDRCGDSLGVEISFKDTTCVSPIHLACAEALCGSPPLSPAMLQSLARGSDEGDRMLPAKANAGEETSSVRSASSAKAKEGSMWTLVHKQCSGSKAPC